MNLDDLENIFWDDVREQPVKVRLARVVRALRDGICDELDGPETQNSLLRSWFGEVLGETEASR